MEAIQSNSFFLGAFFIGTMHLKTSFDCTSERAGIEPISSPKRQMTHFIFYPLVCFGTDLFQILLHF